MNIKATVKISPETLAAIQAIVDEELNEKYGKHNMEEMREYAKQQGWASRVEITPENIEKVRAELRANIEEYFIKQQKLSDDTP